VDKLNRRAYKLINELIIKYNLYPSLSELPKEFIENIGFPDETKNLAIGFWQYQKRKGYKTLRKTNEKIISFFNFIFTLVAVLKNCNSEDEIEHYSKNLTQNCKNFQKLRGFYFELKILSELLSNGFKIESILESCYVNKQRQGVSIPDAIVSKNNKFLQLECKTISESKGHPIIQQAAHDFSNLLLNDKEVSGKFDKLGTYEIQFTFEKPLISNDSAESYSPKTLLQKFKDDIMHGKENLTIEYNKKTNIILTLISTSKNKFIEELFKILNSTITRKRLYDYPLILGLEPYGLPCDEEFIKRLNILLIEHGNKPLMLIFSSRKPCKHLLYEEFILGREHRGFYTKTMTEYLAPTYTK
jgi:hypothetical protein